MKRKHFWIGFGVGFVIAFLTAGIVLNFLNLSQDSRAILFSPHVPLHFKARELFYYPFFHANTMHRFETRRMTNWKAKFPFKATNDPSVRLDRRFLNEAPKRVSGSRLWILRKTLNVALLENHRILKSFFEDEMRFSPQFEQFCNILKEHDRGHDPAQIAGAFRAFRRLWHSAVENNPNDYRMRNGKKIRKSIFGFETWGDQAEQDYHAFRKVLTDWKWLRSRFQTRAGNAEAHGLIGRLLREMRGMDRLPIDVMDYETFDNLPKEAETNLLVPYLGWFSKARENRLEKHFRFDFQDMHRMFFSNSSNSKQAKQTLEYWQGFAWGALNIENHRLVDNEGKPLKPLEGMSMHLEVFGGNETIPLTTDAEGFLTIPSPAEMDARHQYEELHSQTNP